MERNIRLLIEYDGSRYDGWQRLGKGHGVTIQGKLEDVLSKMTGEQVELIGAGRTAERTSNRRILRWRQMVMRK